MRSLPEVPRFAARALAGVCPSLAALCLAAIAATPAVAQTSVHASSHTNVMLNTSVSAEMTDGVLATFGVTGQRTATGGTTGAGFFTSFTEARDDSAPTFPAITRTTVDLRTGQIRGHSTPVPTNSIQFLQTQGRFGEDVTFENTTGAPVAVPFTWNVSSTLIAGNPGSVYQVAFASFTPKFGVPMPTVRGTAGGAQNLYFVFNEPHAAPVQRFRFYNQISGAEFAFGSSAVWNISPLSTTGATMSTELIVPPGWSTVRIDAYLDVQCRGGYTCDYRDGGGANFSLGAAPPGVTAYSASGAFLGLPKPPPPPSEPGAPSGFLATASGNALSLTWTTPSTGGTPTSYRLVGRTPTGALLGFIPLGNVTSYSVAVPNGTYRLSVQASNDLGLGPESNSVIVTLPAPIVPPGAPTNLQSTVSGATANFSWTAPTSGGAVTGYTLLAGTTPSFTAGIASLPVAPGATSVSVPGVPPGTYYARLVAQSGGAVGPPSNEVTVTVAGASAPGAPTLNASASGSTVMLSWSPGSGAAPTSYVLTARTSGGALLGTFPLTGTSASFPGVPSGTYRLTLTAVNDAGPSSPSAEVALVVL